MAAIIALQSTARPIMLKALKSLLRLGFAVAAINPSLRASIDLVPTFVDPLPPAHSYIIGVSSPLSGSVSFQGGVELLTTDETWDASPNQLASGEAWSSGSLNLTHYGIRAIPSSVVMQNPASADQYLILGKNQQGLPALYTYTYGSPGGSQISGTFQDPQGNTVGRGNLPSLAAAASGQVYAGFGQNIYVYAGGISSTPTAIQNFGSETLAARLDGPSTSLLFAGNTLYALDLGNSRILRYDASGSFLGEFSLANLDNGATAFAVSNNGLLFAANLEDPNNSYGHIYNASTGAVVGDFTAPYDANDPTSLGGSDSMLISGDFLFLTSGSGTNLYGYNISGISAVPEPAAFGWLGGLAVLGVAAARRRRFPVS